MASSGTSSFPGRWDVFLSFRGEDTRLNFTDHLYSALRTKGIHTFRDEEGLERGGEIQPSLLKAIEESKVSIVVFSKNYAHSKWCLDELDKIMESRREKGQIVLPVFYHVDPSDLRKQTGSFGEAFARYGEVTEERVLRWREALKEAGGLSGWHMQHGYESDIIHEIAQNIFNRLNRKHLHIDAHLVGMDSRLEEMTSLLCMESNNVRMIGIHGIAGIGKTTLAKLVFNKIADQFERVSFLSSVSEAKDSHLLLQLQRQLLADILGENIALSNIDEGTNVIKHRFCSRKVLVILDDANNLTQLNSFVGNHQWFGPGSRIIITTRDKHLLDVQRVDKFYEVKGLEFEEAFQLFSWKAFKANLPGEGLVNLSEQAVNYCAGLPLALEVLGSFLYGKTKLEWESELQKLQREPKLGIHNVLKISLDGLDHSEKNLFLDIACFFKGEDINFVTKILDSCNFSATGMRVLNDRSLIHISDNKIQMHDLIQQMGRQVVQEECPTQPGKRSRLWDPEDIHAVLTQNTGTEAIEGIFFDMSASKEIKFTTEAFKKMKRLRLLKVYRDGFLPYDADTVFLPEDFEFPSHELRYLHWDGWSLESLPSNFNGEKLVEISLKRSNLKRLWKENEVKRLQNLKVMDLSYSPNLVECPRLSSAVSLERLHLDGCTSWRKLPHSIGWLKNLKTLNLAHCETLRCFPRINGLEKLKVLNLSGCSRLEKFPDIEANMESLLELYLEATAIVELPSSVEYFRSLNVLNMRNCKNLEILPGRLCALKSLKTLILSGCSKLERFPEIPEVMEHLQTLLLDGTSIRELSSSIVNLIDLQLLNLRKCKKLRSLPNSICDLKSLGTLIVSGCSKLNKLPEDLGRLQCLRNLQADGTAITQPPISLVLLTNLEELSFSGCKVSKSNNWISSLISRLLHTEKSDAIGLRLPSLSGLCFLKSLDLSDCNLVEGAIDNKLCHLDSLEVLDLSRNNFVSIPADISGLPNLTDILVRECKRLEKLPKLPPSIKLLDACGCTSLKSLSTTSPIRPLKSTWLCPVKFILWNCSGVAHDYLAMALDKFHENLYPEIGYSIVIPGSRTPKWPWRENMGTSVAINLPTNWLDNKFLGVALYAVFALEEGEINQRPGQIYCEFECREGPYFCSSISWTHGGDRVVETDHMWLIYLPHAHFVKSKSSCANVFRIKACFSLAGAPHVVQKCGISLMRSGSG